eukprot:TRINITY_DN10454_c0_g2_i1.p1 TRINITY_DN10454_c0_g2~~TRINITY_DN10454_c0_g2_i1.p1  ORF type:complete len:394 (+),score=151.31 TRINITY_DN10454_c0_g2_i1:109-1290(+)
MLPPAGGESPGMEKEALDYLRDKQVHKLFERMVKRLLQVKPSNVYRELQALLVEEGAARRGSLDDAAALANTAKSLDSTFTKSLDSTVKSLAPQPGDRGSCHGSRKRLGKHKRVQFKDSEEMFEITDVNVRIERGDFWRDGELEQLKQNQEQTNECYFCCYDPNDCEWSLFSLYEEPVNGDWYLVCPNPDCLAKVKPWWTFSYFMGDSLSRCDLDTVKNIMSYLEPKERRRVTAVAAIWQEAEWEALRWEGGDPARLFADVNTFSFCTLTKDLVVKNLPPGALSGKALEGFASVLCNESLVSFTLVDSHMAPAAYLALLSEDLVLPLTALVIGPLECTTADDDAALQGIVQRLVSRGDDHHLSFTIAGANPAAAALLNALRPSLQGAVTLTIQ